MLNVLHKKQYLIKLIFPTIIVFLIMLSSRQFSGSFWFVVNNIIIFALYLIIFAVPKGKWNAISLYLITAILSIFIITSLIYFHSVINICIMLILIPTLSQELKHPDYLYFSVSVYMEIAALFYIFNRLEYMEFFSLTLIFIVMLLLIRARKISIKAHEITEKYLKELEMAHRELQDAAVISMNYAVLEERNRIAHDIHDAVGHSLTSIVVQLQALRYMIKDNSDEAEKTIENMIVAARKGLSDIRLSVHALAEDRSTLGIAPLKALISQIEASTSIQCNFTSEVDNIPVKISAVFFKIVQEAITNILKHSDADSIEVCIKSINDNYFLSVADNGKLSENNIIYEGFGLTGIRERAKEIGGKVSFETNMPQGFRIIVEIPKQFEE
jgi:signal transduction histidine kinase